MEMPPDGEARWWHPSSDVTLITLRVTPGGRRSEIVECSPERLRVRVAAPAADDKANEELVRFLAEQFGVRRSAVTIVRGHHAREKTVAIALPFPT